MCIPVCIRFTLVSFVISEVIVVVFFSAAFFVFLLNSCICLYTLLDLETKLIEFRNNGTRKILLYRI